MAVVVYPYAIHVCVYVGNGRHMHTLALYMADQLLWFRSTFNIIHHLQCTVAVNKKLTFCYVVRFVVLSRARIYHFYVRAYA
jgi:hypothetical protein